MGVAAGLHVGDAFEAWRGGDQHGGAVRQACPHHGHVAGVVDDAILLLEGGLVFLVHHDEAEIGEWQEQGGTGADDDGGLPSATARQVILRTREGRSECQTAGDSEAALEPLDPLRGQGDFGEHDEGLAAGAQAGGNGFQVDLGFAGAGDAVQQGDRECLPGDRFAQRFGDLPAVGGIARGPVVWVGVVRMPRRGAVSAASRPASVMPRSTAGLTPASRWRSVRQWFLPG